MGNASSSYIICLDCKGRGKKSQRLRKNVRKSYQDALSKHAQLNSSGPPPVKPKGHMANCSHCNGSGLTKASSSPIADPTRFPHIAIIGGGIGGVALAVACLHRGISFTLYERDSSFDARSQGYGLTLQQASKAIEGLGLFQLEDAIVSTRHLVHTTEGRVIGEWGMRKWMQNAKKATPRRTNMHIGRQALRLALLNQLGGDDRVQWGHQLVRVDTDASEGHRLQFMADGKRIAAKADLIVGADGIRSTVRSLFIPERSSPLQYLGCIVILGICPLAALNGLESELLDSATVFQTANGHERIYMMPYDAKTVMWQLSFPLPHAEAKALSAKGAQALKVEACRRTPWHDPIPQILAATQEELISGYPVYDRSILQADWFNQAGATTLIGDAAHPMSPFKGQGANQALLDALNLARDIAQHCGTHSSWRSHGLRSTVLGDFETAMIARSTPKVVASAAAAELLHTELVLQERDAPRGRYYETGEAGKPVQHD